MRHLLLTTLFVGALAGGAGAQTNFFYPSPAGGTVTTTKNVRYGASGPVELMMDVYRPAREAVPAPAVIFFNQSVGTQRTAFTFYVRWGETAAMQGLVGVVPDLRPGNAVQDFQILLAHLVEKAADYGIDRNAIAVYAGSGNVSTALPVLEDPAVTAVKSAVMYYGMATITRFRPDLPLLLVRAGLDRPPVNDAIARMAAAAVAQNAPVTLLNYAAGHHAFEMLDDDATTRAVIEQTVAFVKQTTSATYQAALREGMEEAVAAGYVASGDTRAAATAYARLVAARPADAQLGLAYGEALLADRQFAAACTQFETLEGKGLGPRDLGLPAARACVQKGDSDRAIAWLRSIPQRFLPPDVQKDPAFAALRNRPDFQLLFKR